MVADPERREVVRRRVGADCSKVVQLASERKHLTDASKRVVHLAETVSSAGRSARPLRGRGDRHLVQSMLADACDIAVTDSNLRVTFAPLSSRHRTAVLAALCAEPDALAPHFPRPCSAFPMLA